MKVSAIIPAAGQGKRMGANISKQYLTIDNQMILGLTLKQLAIIPDIIELIIVVPTSDITFCENEILKKEKINKPYKVIPGGQERQDSVRAGLAVLSKEADFVLIHDGARPLITVDLIEKALRHAAMHGSAVLAVPVKDTIKVANGSGLVQYTPNRSTLFAVQTPQIFQREIICAAYDHAILNGFIGTDDASLVEALGQPVYLIDGSYENIKITTPEDLLLAKEILRRREKRCVLE